MRTSVRRRLEQPVADKLLDQFQAETLTTLTVPWNAHFGGPVKGRHSYLASQDGLPRSDGQLQLEVAVIPKAEALVRLKVNAQIEIAPRAAAEAHATPTWHTNYRSILDASGNIHSEALEPGLTSASAADRAGFLVLRSRAAARRTGSFQWNSDRPARPAVRLFQRDGYFRLDIGAPPREPKTSAIWAAVSEEHVEKVAEALATCEQVAQVADVQAGGLAAGRRGRRTLVQAAIAGSARAV